MNTKLLIAYDGTDFSGWQIQPNALSIQQLIEEAIEKILQQKVRVIGSGRTDAGVHARAQIAHFTGTVLSHKKLLFSLNALLPPSIRVYAAAKAPENFHAQHSATGKIYHYHLHLNPVVDPFTRHRAAHFPYHFNREAFELAAKPFIGTHDFIAVANENRSGSAAKNGVRTLQRIDIIDQPGGVRIELEADGFLYKMVRNIVGTMLEAASGKRDPEMIATHLKEKDRRKMGRSVPAKGLILYQVHYPPQFEGI